MVMIVTYPVDYLDPYLPMMKKDDLIQAFRSVLKVSPSHPRNPDFKYAALILPNNYEICVLSTVVFLYFYIERYKRKLKNTPPDLLSASHFIPSFSTISR